MKTAKLVLIISEAIADFWGSCNDVEKETFRAAYPNHWINRAEKVVNEAKGE